MIGTILIILYVIACLFLILVVLLQAGKGGGLGAAFGGGGSAVFGGRGAATFLTKLTAVMAALFMILSVAIAIHLSRARGSVAPEVNLQPEEEEGKDLAKQTEEKPAAEAPKADEKPAEPAQ